MRPADRLPRLPFPNAFEFLRDDSGSGKDKRPNNGPAAWRHQNRNAKLTCRAISSSCSSSLP
jgi:hypothetical protein